MMTKKLLPIGLTDLASIRGKNCYYVDKTPLIVELVTTSSYVFLSRPRRFGKSLTLDTIAELFSGNKALFEGLYAEHHWDWEQTHPVIKLSFVGEAKKYDPSRLEQYITNLIYEKAEDLGVTFDKRTESSGYEYLFRSLVLKAEQKYGKQVVVLIDEYDKPIIDNLDNAEIALEIRGILKSLYSQLKDLASSIRFAMLTGVSKFGQMSLFSGLNHIKDITLQQKYSALCGYTQEELEEVFAPELVGVDLDELKTWYNGYNWTGEAVYNPFDILLFFEQNKDYVAYWVETGGNASFLYNLIQQKHFDFTQIVNKVNSGYLLSSTDIGSLEPIPIMFQTGYLTIDKVIRQPLFGKSYTLKFPNVEVRLSLTSTLLRQWTQDSVSLYRQEQLNTYLRQGDIAGIEQLVRSTLAAIPADWYRNNDISRYEGHWASVFFALFASSSTDIRLEDSSTQGRADMVVLEGDIVYIFEFKVKHSDDAASALAQIKAKNYAEKYRATAKQIYEIGVSFDAQTRELEFAVAD